MRKITAMGPDVLIASLLGVATLALQTYAYLIG